MFIHESMGFCNAGAQMNGESQEKRMNMVWKPNICGVLHTNSYMWGLNMNLSQLEAYLYHNIATYLSFCILHYKVGSVCAKGFALNTKQ